jgi:hypothetical protein
MPWSRKFEEDAIFSSEQANISIVQDNKRVWINGKKDCDFLNKARTFYRDTGCRQLVAQDALFLTGKRPQNRRLMLFVNWI